MFFFFCFFFCIIHNISHQIWLPCFLCSFLLIHADSFFRFPLFLLLFFPFLLLIMYHPLNSFLVWIANLQSRVLFFFYKEKRQQSSMVSMVFSLCCSCNHSLLFFFSRMISKSGSFFTAYWQNSSSFMVKLLLHITYFNQLIEIVVKLRRYKNMVKMLSSNFVQHVALILYVSNSYRQITWSKR